MPRVRSSSLALFHPLVRRWFAARFGQPTGVQREVWPRIASGAHVLATAPTGSGKTLAAFLFALNQLGTGVWEGGAVRVLYISPLKALNNDIRRNLLDPLRELRDLFEREGEGFAEINVMVRSGDTEAAERRRMISHPPEILITTPESLNLLVSSSSGRSILSGVRSVILDEIHAIAGDKRGVYLMSAVERLELLCNCTDRNVCATHKDTDRNVRATEEDTDKNVCATGFQRIALSATVEPLPAVARFIGGYARDGDRYIPRQVEIVRSPDTRQVEIGVRPVPRALRAEDPVWPVLADELRQEIDPARSTLIFVNNRFLAERLSHLINEQEGSTFAWSHHGSLSRELRALVEQRLKDGELPAIVATGSLELGIDIGSVDQVLLVGAPRTLNGAIQRVGRAGHSVGAISRARMHPTHSADLLDAAVLAPLIRRQRPQAVRLVSCPLDVLAQVCVAMCGMEPWQEDELYAFLRTCDSFHELSREAFDLVIQMLQGRYFDARIPTLRARLARDETGALVDLEGALGLIYTSGGVIPDRGYFNIRVHGSRAVLGQLDEEFVWERREGDEFRIGMQNWRVQRISHNDVEVVPAGNAAGAAPFWRGESEDRGFELCEQIGAFLEVADEFCRVGSARHGDFRRKLMEENLLEETAADQLLDYLHRQRAATRCGLPHRHHLVIEHSAAGVGQGGSGGRGSGRAEARQQLIIHASWGASVLRPWAVALSAAWEQRFGTGVETFVTDNCLMLVAPEGISARELLDLVPPGQVQPLLRKKLETTGFFSARFRENAARALLLPRQLRRRMPLWLNRLRSKKLYQQVRKFADFPIIAETWRECLEDHFECARLAELLAEIADGTIAVSEVHTDSPSPFAAALAWRSTNQYMYELDRPFDAAASSLSDQALRQVLHDSALRPRIPQAVIDSLQARLHRTLAGYAPSSADELADVVNERLVVPVEQWEALLTAMGRDGVGQRGEIIAALGGRVLQLLLPGAGTRIFAAVERLPRILRALDTVPSECDPRHASCTAVTGAELDHLSYACATWKPPQGDVAPQELLADMLADMLSYQGPTTLATLHTWLGGPLDRLESALASLVEDGQLILDILRDTGDQQEYCHAENLERLLRLHRASQRPQLVARPAEDLPLFLANLQGVASRGQSMEDLQERLEKLFGYAAPAELWETAILPARMNPYAPQSLDALMQTSDLTWAGAGRQSLMFCMAGDVDLFHAAPRHTTALLPAVQGGFDFFAIEQHMKLQSADLTRRLWDEAWGGLITNDTFATVRKGIENGFEPSELPPARGRRGGRSRGSLGAWQSTRPMLGHWRAIGPPAREPDRLDQIEADKDRARQVLGRYGVIFRDLLARETPALRWGRLLPALRLMELAGEAVAGQFFEGIAGLQFASPEAIRMLGGATPNQVHVYALNAADPASLCGIEVEGLDLPARQAATTLVYHGRRLVLIARRGGKRLEFRVPPDDAGLPRYLAALAEQLTRAVMPPARLVVEEIDDGSALNSAYAAAMETFGFVTDYPALVMYRRY